MLRFTYNRYEIRKQHSAFVKFMFLHSKIKVPRLYSKLLEANKKSMVWNEEYTLGYKA